MNNNAWIQTFSGKQFFPENPTVESIDILDIAHALSMICRFTGHVRGFWSVGQHSLMVSHICKPENALWGLLHDASEAYICDIPRPIKHLDEMAPYRLFEQKAQAVICQRFNLSLIEPEDIKLADNIMLATEKRDLMMDGPGKWLSLPEPLSVILQPMTPLETEQAFLRRFFQLTL